MSYYFTKTAIRKKHWKSNLDSNFVVVVEKIKTKFTRQQKKYLRIISKVWLEIHIVVLLSINLNNKWTTTTTN